jgi:4'-phosphopantetheinyl transferase
VCVITENYDIGVDVEKLSDIKVEDFKSQMTPTEWYGIISSNDIRTSFFEYWTQKEAVIKAHGMGLSIPLKSFEVQNNYTRVNEESFFLKKVELDNECKSETALLSLNPKRIKPFINV